MYMSLLWCFQAKKKKSYERLAYAGLLKKPYEY